MRRPIWKVIKKVLLGLGVILVILIVVYHELVGYGIRQGIGQATIIWKAKPVDDFLSDPKFPDSLKVKLRLIEEVRHYATDSLGLEDTRNYRTMFDQKGQEIMWVVTACEPFRLKPKEWTFPVLGAVPYKGFFKKEKALALKEELEKEGWDVSIRNPGGWSTLGWFTDPILSKMLERTDGDLANLIIHEMSHATIFVRDSIEFNENLATFIGDRGAERFLIDKYGVDSREYLTYIHEDKDYLKYVDHMLHGTEVLDSLYHTFREDESQEQKLRKKKVMIQQIVMSLDTLSLSTMGYKPSSRFREKLPNNAYFMNFKRYQSKQVDLWTEYRDEFHGDLRAYIQHMRDRYPFL